MRWRAVVAVVFVQGSALAHEVSEAHEHDEAGEVRVKGERAGREAASRAHVSGLELELRPRLGVGALVEAVPGLFAVQHAGGGKANQYFLRGFDADHGTDVAFFVDGVPVNMPSHAHGQGYADLHFVIPELIVGLDGYKGPYHAHLGDFATAGAVSLQLAERLDESYARVQVGQHGIQRTLIVESPKLGDSWRAVFAAEAHHADGPFENAENLSRFNLFARVGHDLDAHARLAVTWMSYGSRWNGSGPIPARAVCGEGEAKNPPPSAYGQPCIDRFGFVDPTDGGAGQRHMGSARFVAVWDDAKLDAMAYVIRYDSSLFSNFTFFARDPVRGDQIEQDDGRWVGGGDVRFKKTFRQKQLSFTTTLGAQLRVDAIDGALRHDEARARIEDRASSSVTEGALGVFAEEDARLGERLRFVAGARVDRVDVKVTDRLPASASRDDASGAGGGARLSPKLMGVVSPAKWLDLFVDWGRGFHTNDARGAVLRASPARLITPATGWELGAKLTPVKDLSLTAAAFLLDLASELVWSGDEGTTEPSGATRRYGVELGARWRLANWLFADVDATFTHAAFRANAGNAEAVALAPRATFTAGLAAKRQLGDLTPFGAARVKAIADRPAIEDASLTAQGFAIVDLEAGLRWKNLELALDVQNLTGARWREVTFASRSRLRHEPAPVTGVHYSPGWPFTAIGRATVYW